MVDLGSISAGLASLKAAKDIAETLVNLRDTAKFQSAVVELQGKILAAQTDQFSLLERIRDLETKMAKLEAWETEKKRYKLTDYGGATFAYALKPDAADGEPTHRLCATCYSNGHKSILHFVSRSEGQDWFECRVCKDRHAYGARQSGSGYRPYDDD